ncbi:hypothetical protein [Rhinolophus gammaherpesvirus 1]|uniref:Uncharacterized protein n=1 Tax=Rhinolophus gammaherpesvirus 1 TaxID=2054179 RepID=A0A2Z5U693_9GAMA|nr:hypothetical protein [Rhinolophus gammaherpesvirus 1]BBB06453.1 hypothetical protein [Rhinolophus gammaherpesvirus 1]
MDRRKKKRCPRGASRDSVSMHFYVPTWPSGSVNFNRDGEGVTRVDFSFSMVNELCISALVKFETDGGSEGDFQSDPNLVSGLILNCLKEVVRGNRIDTRSELPPTFGSYMSSEQDPLSQPWTLSLDAVPLIQEILDNKLNQDPVNRKVVVQRVNFFHTYWSRHPLRPHHAEGSNNNLASELSFYRTPGDARFRILRPSREPLDLVLTRVAFPVSVHPKADLLCKIPDQFNDPNLPFLEAFYDNAVKTYHTEHGRVGYSLLVPNRASTLQLLNVRLDEEPLENCQALAHTIGRLSGHAPELDVFFHQPSHWGEGTIWALHLGIIGNSSSIQELQEYTEAHMLAQRCSGFPTLQGFFRVLNSTVLPPMTSLINPFSYTGSLSIANCLPKIQNYPTKKKISVFMLGDFFQYPVCEDGYEYHDSGKNLGSILNVIEMFTNLATENSSKGVSRVYLTNTMHAKITAVCGTMGFRTTVSLLPKEVTTGLLSFTEPNSETNQAIIRSKFLNVSAPVLLLAILDTPQNCMLLREICQTFGCQVSQLGRLSNVNGIIFHDDRETSCFREVSNTISFKHYKPRFSLPMSPDQSMLSYRPMAPSREPYHSRVPQVPSSAQEVLTAILQHPTVGSKAFVVRHIDRLTSGRVARQPGVGPIDCPVADYHVTVSKPYSQQTEKAYNYWTNTKPGCLDKCLKFEEDTVSGMCGSLGEQNTIFPFYPKAGAKLAITESCLGLALAPILSAKDIIVNICLTWPHYRESHGEISTLLQECREFCSEANVSCNITSCTSSQDISSESHETRTNLKSLVASASAFAPDVSLGVTPDLKEVHSRLMFVPVSKDFQLFGSIYQQVRQSKKYLGTPCEISASYLASVLEAIVYLRKERFILSGHDVNDGGLWAALVEMAISGMRSIDIVVPRDREMTPFLVSETPGLVLEIPLTQIPFVKDYLSNMSLTFFDVGAVGHKQCERVVNIFHGSEHKLSLPLTKVQADWSNYSSKMEGSGPSFDRFKLSEEAYLQEREAYVTHGPYSISGGVNPTHKVTILLLPGCPIPEAMVTALSHSGFRPQVVPLAHMTSFLGEDVCGLCIVGHNNMSDTGLADRLTNQLIPEDDRETLNSFLLRGNTFSLGIGSMACEILFHTKIHYNFPGREPPRCIQTASSRFESRWLNFLIPSNTNALAFNSLKGSLLPCWIQGTHLGFEFESNTDAKSLTFVGHTASLFYGHNMSSGPASTYPLNPSGKSSISGLCSADGRHLVLLHDPTLSFFMWQWPHVPKSNIPISVSPWKQMFYDLHRWVIRNH